MDVVENLIKRLLPSPVETTQETDPVPSDYELLAQSLCEMAQPPVLEDSDTIDIEQLLRKLIPVGPVVEEAVQPTPEFQEVDDRESGKRHLIRGGGLVIRISDDKEPQFHINRKYRHQPVTEKDTVNRAETMWPNGYGPEWNSKNYNDPRPCYPDSDESDSDEMLPLGAFRPTPEEEEWTIVSKPHGVQRYNKDIDCNQLNGTRDKLDHSGMCCKQLDYIDRNVVQYDLVNTVDSDTRSEVVPIRRNEATQNDSSPSSSRNGPQSHRLTSEPVLTSVDIVDIVSQ